jgi:nicotinamidase/pyrazinamidase
MGTRGHSIVPAINTALQFWAKQRQRVVQYIHKGESLRSEAYSVLRYEVEDSLDPRTSLNDDLIEKLKIADKLLVCGQSLNHTVCYTTRGK